MKNIERIRSKQCKKSISIFLLARVEYLYTGRITVEPRPTNRSSSHEGLFLCLLKSENNMELKDLKVQVHSHQQFLDAWDALVKLGYIDKGKPETCPYLYAYSTGRITHDFFDPEDVDTSSENSAASFFRAHKHEEISIEDLIKLTQSPANENTMNSESIHFDPNGVMVTHNIWLETPTETVELVPGHYYDVFAGT